MRIIKNRDINYIEKNLTSSLDHIDIRMEVDVLSNIVYGISRTEAIKQDICFKCKIKINKKVLKQISKTEYRLSGLCKECFSELLNTR